MANNYRITRHVALSDDVVTKLLKIILRCEFLNKYDIINSNPLVFQESRSTLMDVSECAHNYLL